MRKFRTVLAVLALAPLMAAAALAQPAPLAYVPASAEVVIGVNPRQVTQSEPFQRVLAERPKLQARANVIQNITGANVLTDLDQVVLFGRTEDKSFGGVIVKGRFDRDKLLNIAKANPQYETLQIGEQTVHAWHDGHEKRMKYGAFLPGDLVAVWNSKESAEANLAAANQRGEGFAASPRGELIPAEAEQAAAWAVLDGTRNVHGPAAKYRIDSALAVVTLANGDVTAALTLVPTDAQDTPRWVEVGEGIAAFLQLQPDKRLAPQVGQRMKVAVGADQKSVTISTSLDQQTVMAIIDKKFNKAKRKEQ